MEYLKRAHFVRNHAGRQMEDRADGGTGPSANSIKSCQANPGLTHFTAAIPVIGKVFFAREYRPTANGM